MAWHNCIRRILLVYPWWNLYFPPYDGHIACSSLNIPWLATSACALIHQGDAIAFPIAGHVVYCFTWLRCCMHACYCECWRVQHLRMLHVSILLRRKDLDNNLCTIKLDPAGFMQAHLCHLFMVLHDASNLWWTGGHHFNFYTYNREQVLHTCILYYHAW